MSISGIGSIQNVQSTAGTARTTQTQSVNQATATVPQGDDVKISDAARQMETTAVTQEPLSQGVRLDLINRVRAEIAAGTYDSPEKMDVAVDRLLGRLNPK